MQLPNKLQKGFTLIELIIVIGILGILATVIIVSINPLEQFAKSRDTGRKQAVSQLGTAMQSYYASNDSNYPAQSATWMNLLQTNNEIKALPNNPQSGGYTTGCNTANIAQNGYCFQSNSTTAMVYARLESKTEFNRAACASGQTAWIVWSSADGKAGVTCTATNSDPSLGITGLK